MSEDVARLGYEIDSSQALNAADNLSKMSAAAERSARSMSVSQREGAKQSRSLDQVVRAAQSSQRQIDRLAKAQRQGQITGAQFTGELNKIAASLRAMGMDRAQSEVMQYARATSEAERAQGELSRAVASSSAVLSTEAAALDASSAALNRRAGAMGAAGANTTNLMFQMQDIGMMTAAMQNPLMLAMQQGTQVTGVFHQMRQAGQRIGPAIASSLGAMINPMSLVTLGAIAGGAALVQWGISAFDAADEAFNLEDALDQVEGVLNDVDRATNILSTSTYDLVAQYGMAATRVRELAVAELQLAVARQRGAVSQQMQNEELQDAIGAYGDLSRQVGVAGNVFYDTTDAARAIARDLGVTNAEASRLAVAFYELQNAPTVDDQVAAWQRIQELLSQSNVSLEDIPPSLATALSGVVALESATIDLEAALARAAAQGANLSTSLAMTPFSSFNTSGGFLPGPGMTTGPMLNVPAWMNLLPPSAGGGGAGGGGAGGGINPQSALSALERLLGQFTDDPYAEATAWYNEALEALYDAQLIERGMMEEHNAYRLQIEQTYAQQLAEIESQQQDERLGHYESFFGTMASVFQSGGERMLGISRAFGIAEATISMWRGAAKALELPFPANLAAWAKVLATGVKAIQGIKNAGGGGGGGASSGAANAAVPAAAPERVIRVDFDGPDWARDMFQSFQDQLYENSRDGTRVIFAR